MKKKVFKDIRKAIAFWLSVRGVMFSSKEKGTHTVYYKS